MVSYFALLYSVLLALFMCKIKFKKIKIKRNPERSDDGSSKGGSAYCRGNRGQEGKLGNDLREARRLSNEFPLTRPDFFQTPKASGSSYRLLVWCKGKTESPR